MLFGKQNQTSLKRDGAAEFHSCPTIFFAMSFIVEEDASVQAMYRQGNRHLERLLTRQLNSPNSPASLKRQAQIFEN
jgi:hypothetical protein